MTREEVSKRIQALCECVDEGSVLIERAESLAIALDEVFGELDRLRAPPSPAPSMQEIERLVADLATKAHLSEEDGPTFDATCEAGVRLLRAIRSALGHDRYAEGWRAGAEAMREAAAQAFDFYWGPAPGSLGEFVRRVPLPAPEVRTQDKDGER